MLDGLLDDGLLLLQSDVRRVVPVDRVRWAAKAVAGLLLQRRDGDLSSSPAVLPVGAVQELHPQDVDDPAQRAELLGVLEEVLVDLRGQPVLQLDQVGMLLLHHCRPTAAATATAVAAAPSGRTHVALAAWRDELQLCVASRQVY